MRVIIFRVESLSVATRSSCIASVSISQFEKSNSPFKIWIYFPEPICISCRLLLLLAATIFRSMAHVTDPFGIFMRPEHRNSLDVASAAS